MSPAETRRQGSIERQGHAPSGGCPHDDARRRAPRAAACEACGMDHQLRVCNACGHVGCADSHEGHASAHARETGHALLRELAEDDHEDETWVWCAECEAYVA